MESQHNHPIYKQAANEKEADGIARAFIDTKPTQIDFPFKFPDIKPYEIRARITHTGLCHSDVHHSKGEWGPPTHPLVTGHEVIAVATHIGSEVKDFKVGDRVAWGPRRYFCGKCEECTTGNNNLCHEVKDPEAGFLYDPYFGGYATHIQAPAMTAFHVPEKLPSDKAPPLLCAGVTLYAPLVRWGKKGIKCAVIGIGGLGHVGVKFAAKLGYHVTAFTSKPKEKEEEIKKMGAEAVVSSADIKELNKLAGQFHLVLNTFYTNDTELMNAYLGLTRQGHTFVQIAAPDVNQEKPKININALVLGQINFCGSLIGSVKETQDMLNFAAEHNVLPECENFEWEDWPKAFEKCEKGIARYRCVVNCENYAKKKGLPQ